MWLVQHMAWVTLLFFPFFQRGVYMALCSWNKDLVWMELRLAGVRPKNFSAYPSSLLFLGKIVSPSSWNSNRPHPWKKKQHHVQSLHSWGWCGGAVSGFHHPPPPLFSFYFRTVPISWNTPQEHVWGFELGPLFPQLTATFRLLRCGPCEWVQLGFLYGAVIPLVPKRWWHMKPIWQMIRSHSGQKNICIQVLIDCRLVCVVGCIEIIK